MLKKNRTEKVHCLGNRTAKMRNKSVCILTQLERKQKQTQSFSLIIVVSKMKSKKKLIICRNYISMNHLFNSLPAHNTHAFIAFNFRPFFTSLPTSYSPTLRGFCFIRFARGLTSCDSRILWCVHGAGAFR